MSFRRKATILLLCALTSFLSAISAAIIIEELFEKRSFIVDASAFTEKREISYAEEEYNDIQKVKKSTQPTNDLYSIGWIPDWDLADGFTTLQQQKDSFDAISPVWFWVNEDGSLDVQIGANNSEFISFTKENNIDLVPTITLFDADILHSVLQSEENTQRHIDEIVSQVVINDYEGIDLDYESTYVADKDELYAFIQELADQLHAENKMISFTVLPKWGDFVNYPSLPQTRRVQDYSVIAEMVDEFRIMTYEFSGRLSDEVGPVAPIQWMKDTLKYALLKDIPREKLVLGIHTYSYDYPSRPIANSIFEGHEYLFFDFSEEAAVALFPKDIVKIQNQFDFREEYNEEWEEMLMFYEFEGKERIIVHPNQQAIDARKQLAEDFGIKGVAYWRIGDDGELQY